MLFNAVNGNDPADTNFVPFRPSAAILRRGSARHLNSDARQLGAITYALLASWTSLTGASEKYS
jgi:hypothetical protein